MALVRVSGEQAGTALTSMTIPATLPQPRSAVLRHIVHPITGMLGMSKNVAMKYEFSFSFSENNLGCTNV